MTATSTSHRWNAEDELASAKAYLHDVRAAAPDIVRATGTLRDVIQRQPPRGGCYRGPKLNFTSVERGTVSNQRRRCRGADCARCLPGWCSEHLSKILRAWDGAPVHRSVFLPSGGSWLHTARGRAISAAYPKGARGYVRVAVGTEGESWVFHPGEVPGYGSEPVEAPGPALAEALLHAPTTVRAIKGGKGVQRITNHARPAPVPEDDAESAEWVPPADLHTIRLRADTCVEEDVLRTAEVRVGHPISWDTKRQRADTTHEWNLDGLPEHEVLIHRQVAEEYRAPTAEELAAQPTVEEYRRRYPGLFAGLRS